MLARRPAAPEGRGYSRVAVVVGVASAIALSAGRAAADGQIWTSIMTRVPVASELGPAPSSIRLSAESRFLTKSWEPSLVQARIAPRWDVASWLRATFGAVVRGEDEDGAFLREYRVYAQPTFVLGLGDWSLKDRNRVELRSEPGRTRWRYRNRVEASFEPEGSPWSASLSEELMVWLTPDGLDENRAIVALGRKLTSDLRLQLGYLLLSEKQASTWSTSHVLVATFEVEPKR